MTNLFGNPTPGLRRAVWADAPRTPSPAELADRLRAIEQRKKSEARRALPPEPPEEEFYPV